MLRWASGIMVVLGAGHLVLLTVIRWDGVAGWVTRGGWAAVPLFAPERTVAGLDNSATFWAGPGSFSVPLVLLGCLVWHLAGRGVAVPAGIGWGITAWCLVGGVLLVPSPFFVGTVAGVLVVLAARKQTPARTRTPAAHVG
ncbi:DUF6463 family protein [Saccharothrix espanaensis]|uniref:Putative membrane protein n=1 Tax=Saccharothrix espanaensis (strain ATCC 51144 / DSM 44229 / JCM 9112 / NBRC 15066 / NRRL 15764) TaxID=1179773 RepID=K0K129_SACES|nr:DUF6463 family protein [Saccharothrix espanaensis]CCH30283.1 putative membrane protein [Saccharothrix espanaensis DSM 44229]